MQLLQLQYFLVVAKTEHMSKAALHLNISQSSLSKTIAKLEDELGVLLFNRIGKNIKLSEYGFYYARQVEDALMILNNAKEEVQELANIKEEKIHLNAITLSILPSIIKNFYDKRPNIRIYQTVLPDNIAKEKLINGDINLCISNTPILGPNIQWLPLLKERLDLIVPLNHPLAKFDEINLLEAKNEKFIGYKSSLESISMYEKCCLNVGFTPKIVFEGTELSIVLQLVNEGQGISLYPQYSFLKDQLPNTKIIRLKNDDCYQTVGLAWLKDKKYSYVVNQFRQHMIESFNKINNN